MAIQIKLKNSVVQDSTPSASDLPEVGELAVNANINSIGGFMRASDNSIVKIFGPGSLSTPTATTTVSGISELATNSETTTGTATNRVVTPAGLNAVTVAERTTSNTNYVAKAGSTLTGVLTMPNGSNSTPAINFGDSDSGIFGGTNTVSLAAGGTTRLTADTGVSVVGTLAVTGAITSTSDLTIADKIIHAGDTNTAVRFPTADTVSVETGGSEKLRVDSLGRLLIGTSSSNNVAGFGGSALQVEGLTGATSSMSLIRHSANNVGPTILLSKSRGTSNGATTIVQNNDIVARIFAYGADGTDTESQLAGISYEVDGTPGANDMPGRLVFSTTADGASSSTTRLTIDSAGVSNFTGDINVTSTLPVINLIDSNNNDDFAIKNVNGVFTIRDATNGADRLTINSNGKTTFLNDVDHNGTLTIESTQPTIQLNDTNANDDFAIRNIDGVFGIRDITNGSNRLTIDSNGVVNISGNTDFGAGIDVTGAITGTTSGTDVGLTITQNGTGNILNLYDGGNLVFKVNSVGNPTVTSTNPVYASTNSSSSVTTTLFSNLSGQGVLQTNSGSDLIFGTGAVEKVRITSSGLVGIATSSPAQRLHVYGNSGFTAIAVGDNSTTEPYLLLEANETDNLCSLHSRTNNSLTFKIDNSERMRIDTVGRLGLGTASPDGQLHVFSNSAGSVTAANDANDLVVESTANVGMSFLTANDSLARIKFGDPDDNGVGGIVYSHVDNFMQYKVNGSERMRIASTGDVLIATTSASIFNDTSGGAFNLKADGQLVIKKQASSSADPLVWLNDTGQTTNKSIVFAQDGSEKANIGLAGNDATITVNGSERMRIDSSGNVGIGTTSPSAGLHISTTVQGLDVTTSNPVVSEFKGSGGAGGYLAFQMGDNGANIGYLGDSGQLVSTGGTNDFLALRADNGIEFAIGTAREVRVDSDGIKFGSDTAAANALDDYEEGTFTPEYNTGTSGSAMFDSCNYNNTTGEYTKVGRLVTFAFRIQASNIVNSNSGSQVIIVGLPFTSLGSGGGQGGAEINYSQAVCSTNNGYLPTLHIANNSSNIMFFTCNGNSYGTGDTNNNFTHTLHIHGQYYTAS